MIEKLKSLKDKVMKAAGDAAVVVGDLNGDGKVDAQDARIAAEWAKKTTGSVADEAFRMGKEAVRSDLAKDAAAGAAIGAVIAVPVPIIGPMVGAVIGGGLGVYKNLNRKGAPPVSAIVAAKPPLDLHAELLKLADLREKGILSEAEFDGQKKRLLGATA